LLEAVELAASQWTTCVFRLSVQRHWRVAWWPLAAVMEAWLRCSPQHWLRKLITS